MQKNVETAGTFQLGTIDSWVKHNNRNPIHVRCGVDAVYSHDNDTWYCPVCYQSLKDSQLRLNNYEETK